MFVCQIFDYVVKEDDCSVMRDDCETQIHQSQDGTLNRPYGISMDLQPAVLDGFNGN